MFIAIVASGEYPAASNTTALPRWSRPSPPHSRPTCGETRPRACANATSSWRNSSVGPCAVCRLSASRGMMPSRTKCSVRSCNSTSSAGIEKSICRSASLDRRAPAPLAERDVDAGSDDDSGAEPGPRIREVVEDGVAEDRRPDQLDVAERRDHRRRPVLKGADHQVMPRAAEQAEAAEQQDVGQVLRHDKDEGER